MKVEYPALIIPAEEGGYLVDFPDFEGGAFTEGDTLEKALFNAGDVLNLVLEDRLEKGQSIPTSGRQIESPGVHMIAISID